MTYSLGEVEALSRKAVRGAGLSWGMAEDASKAVRWLCSWGLPGTEALAGYLDAMDGTAGPDDASRLVWSANSGKLCPIICGTVTSDRALLDADIQLNALSWPLLIVPHVAWIAPKGCVSWEDGHVTWDDQVYVSGNLLAPFAGTVTLSSVPKQGDAMCQRTSRADLSTEILVRLNGFAAKTYAPETEASKISGAGAGLKDGD